MLVLVRDGLFIDPESVERITISQDGDEFNVIAFFTSSDFEVLEYCGTDREKAGIKAKGWALWVNRKCQQDPEAKDFGY